MVRLYHVNLAVFLVLIFLFPGLARADSFKNLKASEVKALLDGSQEVLVLNPLSDIEYNENHIPGSVNIPLYMISSSDRLPGDKSTPIVTYCLGPK
jgi:3-mercaptopyruvate sulfurtransferase SseA